MGLYLYQHPETQEIKEIFQSMNSVHEYEENGVKWKRVFTIGQASTDTRIDPFDSRSFVEKTASKKGTIGGLLDLSKELSEKRESKMGKDTVKEKYFKNYSNLRRGKLHPEDPRRNIDKTVLI